MPTVATGLEVCLGQPPRALARARCGLLVNQASVDRRFRYAHHRFAERFPGQLRALFAPQHGLWGEQQDNMIETPHADDPELGVPVYSLYADTRRPTPAMLEGLDCLVVDLQDVGTRVYTFAWTLLLCLRACAEVGVTVVVLDRPNPLGGRLVEGPLLDPAFASFVGMLPIPMRHGLTLGELARLMNREVGAELDVVAMRGWNRAMTFEHTGLPWLPPSPNLPRLEGVAVYPGQVVIEGTNLSEGRGTTTPFEVIGAPFVDSVALCRAIAERALPGLVAQPYRFEPTFHKWSGQSCGGAFLHVVDAAAFRPYRTTLELLAAIKELWPDELAWRSPPYEYETRRMPVDILTGSSRVREALDARRAVPAELAEVDAAAWWEQAGEALLYE